MKEGTSAVLLQSGLGERWWSDSMECFCYRGVNLERRHSDCGSGRIGKVRRTRNLINAKEVLISQKNEFIFSFADGTGKLSGRDYEFREPTPGREQTVRSEDLSGELQGELGSLNRQNQQTTLKPVPTSGRSKVTSSIVITMNLEFNSMCRRKKHHLFH